MLLLEIWRPIDNYHGYYEVSNLGRVKALERTVVQKNGVAQRRRERIKALTETPDGYLTVKLSKDGVDERVAVHILVAKAFVDGWFEGAEVNHIDFNRKNNIPDNLEWVTHRDNINHTLLHGRHVSQWGDYTGCNNPNYGNHILHEIYSNNKDYAIEKQSRPGAQNGRAVPIRMYINDNTYYDFGYIRACAQYMIDNGLSSSQTLSTVAVNISRALSNRSTYSGCRYDYI